MSEKMLPKFHPLLEAGDTMAGATMIRGFVGPGGAPATIRVYPRMDNLGRYYEFPTDGILHFTEPASANEPTELWVAPSTTVQRVSIVSLEARHIMAGEPARRPGPEAIHTLSAHRPRQPAGTLWDRGRAAAGQGPAVTGPGACGPLPASWVRNIEAFQATADPVCTTERACTRPRGCNDPSDPTTGLDCTGDPCWWTERCGTYDCDFG